MQHPELSRLLQQGDFGALFIRMMGWDNPEQRLPVDVAESALRPVPVADKRGVTAWRVDCPERAAEAFGAVSGGASSEAAEP